MEICRRCEEPKDTSFLKYCTRCMEEERLKPFVSSCLDENEYLPGGVCPTDRRRWAYGKK